MNYDESVTELQEIRAIFAEQALRVVRLQNTLSAQLNGMIAIAERDSKVFFVKIESVRVFYNGAITFSGRRKLVTGDNYEKFPTLYREEEISNIGELFRLSED